MRTKPETIQEAFLLLNLTPEMIQQLSKWQKFSIAIHAYNLFTEMDCVGMKEGASQEEVK